MKKLYYFIFVFVFGFKSLKVAAQTTSPADYFRSAKTGSWHLADTWESSSDGINNWQPSQLPPTSEANTITVLSGDTITISNNAVADQVIVASGGVLTLATGPASGLTIANGPGSDITVQSGGIFRHSVLTGGTLPVFSPSSVLEIQSGGTLEALSSIGNPSNYAIPDSVRNVLWSDGAIFNWNNTSKPTSTVTYFPALPAIPVFRFTKRTSIGGATPTVINGLLEALADIDLASMGTKTFRNGIIGTGKVAASSVSSGKFIINGSTAILGGAGIVELSKNGLLINTGTILTLTSDKTINNFSTSISTITSAGTLIAGDHVISGTSKVEINGTVRTTNANGLSGGTNTTFSTTAGLTVNAAGSSSVIEYNRLGDQIVTPLAYKSLLVTGSGAKTAGSGADISVSDTLNIMPGNTFALNGINNLKLNTGGVLNINTAAVFDNGGESQVGGGGTPIINIYGTFITRDAQGFSGLNTSIPGGKINIFPASNIEYGRAGDQDVTKDDYRNLTFSGSGVKSLSTCSPRGTVTIKDNVIVDASNKTFGDTNTNLTMTGGRFRVGGTETKPDINGIYNLTGGVIEFTNSGNTLQTIRTPLTYLKIEISGTNVGNSKGIMTIADGGSFTVKTGGNFENTSYRIDGLSGNQTFNMEAGATFRTGVKGGFSGNDSAALRNIETLDIDPKSTIVYSHKGNQIITPLNAYPTLLLKGSGNKTVAAGLAAISSGADSVVIDTSVVLKISSGAKIDFQNRPVIIHSSATATGVIGEITDGASALLNATAVTVERFIPKRRAFRFISPSVTTTASIKANWMEGGVNNSIDPPFNDPHPGYGTNITGRNPEANGFDATRTTNPSIYKFNAANQRWDSVPNTHGSLSAGDAYSLLVRGDRSTDMRTNNPDTTNTILRAAGKLWIGTYSPVLSNAAGKYTFIGNPYASPVNFKKMWANSSTTNVASSYYAFDPRLSRRGAYVSYNAFNDKTSDPSSEVNENIQPGQAFFVQTNNDGSASINFEEGFKSIGNTKVFGRNPSVVSNLSIQLLLSLNEGLENNADGVTSYFDKDFSTAIGNEDSYKFTNLDENLAINHSGTSLSMEGRPTITANDTIPLKIWQFRQKNYYLKLTGSNFSPELKAFVKDAYLHKENPVDLSTVTLFPFTIDTAVAASSASDRFSIVFETGSTLPVTLTEVRAYQKDPGIQVEWTTNTEINIDRYEIEKSTDGQHFSFEASVTAKESNVTAQKYNWLDANAIEGNNFYRLKIIEKSGAVRYSRIINVNVNKSNPGITIYPNPITKGIINLHFRNIEKGKYTIVIFNNLAQEVYNGTIEHTNLSGSYQIPQGKAMSKGVYRMTVSKKDKKITKTLIFK